MIFGKVRVAAACAALLLMAACSAGPRGEDPSGDGGESLTTAQPTGDAKTSPNVKRVAHVPRTAPLNGAMDWNTDLAFQGDYAYVGNFGGFSIYDISDPAKPKTVSQVACPAEQNDVSIYGDLLILSIDEPRSDDYVFQGYELTDALEAANGALSDDARVSAADGRAAEAKPFERNELLKPLERWFFGR